ncbi:hypothetical protein ACQ4PT_063533 [Festuca glaucescens]
MLRYLVPLFLAAAAATTATATFVLEEATIESIHRAFAGGELTSRGLVELYLRRIASLDPALHAVVELDADGALAAADRAGAARLLGGAALPPLHGIPVLIKDNIAAAGALMPICRTVSDAVNVLEAIVGYDPRDPEATRMASQYIPEGGYRQFLNIDGLRGKRIGILRKDFFRFPPGSIQEKVFRGHFDTMRQLGAILVDNLEIPSMKVINDAVQSGERALMLAEFKLSLNSYLSELATTPVRSLSNIIDFNNKHPVEERTAEFGQSYLVQSEATNGIGPTEERAIAKLNGLCVDGLEKIVRVNQLDAIVAPGASAHSLLAIGGYPAITVPAGYALDGVPFAICFGGLKGSEPKLIEISYSFEQATKVRRPPPVLQYSAL